MHASSSDTNDFLALSDDSFDDLGAVQNYRTVIGCAKFVDLLEGDVDWKAVMAAFVKVGYRGTMSPEYSKIFAMA